MHASSDPSPTPASARAPSLAADHDSSELPSSPSTVPISSLLADGFLLASSRGSPPHEAMDVSDYVLNSHLSPAPELSCLPGSPSAPVADSNEFPRLPFSSPAYARAPPRPPSPFAQLPSTSEGIRLQIPSPSSPPHATGPRHKDPTAAPKLLSEAPRLRLPCAEALGLTAPPLYRLLPRLCSRPPGYPLPTLAFSFGQPRRLSLRSTTLPPKSDSTVPTASTDDGFIPTLAPGAPSWSSPRAPASEFLPIYFQSSEAHRLRAFLISSQGKHPRNRAGFPTLLWPQPSFPTAQGKLLALRPGPLCGLWPPGFYPTISSRSRLRG